MYLAVIGNIYTYTNAIINVKNSQNSRVYVLIETTNTVSVLNKKISAGELPYQKAIWFLH